jgi:hypothetical protein
MKNEILEFFNKNKDDFEYIIEDSKLILNSNKVNDQKSFILINIIYEFLKEEKIEVLFSKTKEILEESIFLALENFIKEEQGIIIDYFTSIKIEKDKNYPKLIDFEWKFVGLSTIENFEKGEVIPKILLKLKFNTGFEKLIETDYSNLKKLQEEIEENLSSFNSTYARRIESFSK